MTDATFTELIERIKAMRKARGWSAEMLAQRMTYVGIPWERQVVTKLENGRRRVLSFAELLALSYVFDVPGLLLAFPVGSGETVEVLPGRREDAWTAAKWFMGEGHIDGPAATGLDAAAAPITLRRRHDRLITEYQFALGDKTLATSTTDVPAIEHRLELVVRDLRAVRAEMRRHGQTPPELLPEMAHIDDRRHTYLTPEEARSLPRGSVKPVDFSERLRFEDEG